MPPGLLAILTSPLHFYHVLVLIPSLLYVLAADAAIRGS